jgi:hypothetical protein
MCFHGRAAKTHTHTVPTKKDRGNFHHHHLCTVQRVVFLLVFAKLRIALLCAYVSRRIAEEKMNPLCCVDVRRFASESGGNKENTPPTLGVQNKQ